MQKSEPKSKKHVGPRIRAKKADPVSVKKIADVSPLEIKKVIHELHVHQVELETQNEQLRQAQIEIAEARKKYADLYDFAPVGYFTFDKKGKIIETNVTGASLLGSEKRSLAGQPFRRFVTPRHFSIFQSHLQMAIEIQSKQSCKLQLTRKDGSLFDGLIDTIAVMDRDGNFVHYRSSVTDISEIAQAEMALKERTVQLEAACRELESFSYSVSHDLRAPLRAIDGYARLILKNQGDKFDGETLRRFNDIRLNAHVMGQLIDDLLTFSRLGRKQMSITHLDMHILMKDAWKELQASDPERNIKFTVTGMPLVYGDMALIKQVLINLLSNAAKFTKYKDAPNIEVGGYTDSNEHVYLVRDNGAGLDMTYYDKLFGVFQRLHGTEQFEGTGVGLATVQRIIRRHGGRVWAEGKVNEGATFYFSLPLSHTHTHTHTTVRHLSNLKKTGLNVSCGNHQAFIYLMAV